MEMSNKQNRRRTSSFGTELMKFIQKNPTGNLRNMGFSDLGNGIGEFGGFAWFSLLGSGLAPLI